MESPDGVRDGHDVRRWDLECDVLVVGLGAAGACAALEASRAGARVLAIERASGGGGTSALSGGVLYLGGGTPLQRECGFEDSPEEMYKYLMASCGEEPDEAKIRAYCQDSVAHFHWIVEQGVPFKPVFYPHYSGEPPTDDGLVYSGSENAYPFDRMVRPAPRGHVPRIEGQAGGLLMRTLLAAVERSAAQVRTDGRCKALMLDSDVGVVGATIQIDGEEHCLRARRGVILTTGGFINNREMIDRYCPPLARCKFRVGAEGDDGSGIRMGLAAGARVLHMDKGSISLPIHPPKSLSRGILVNRLGQRFINEDVYLGRLGEYALYRHDGCAYLVLDDESFVRPEVEREIAGVGGSIEELERELELPPGSLIETLADYSRHAEKGDDPVFHKAAEYVTPLVHPPFAALDCTTENSLYAAFTLGGLDTRVDGEVLTPEGEIIPGLYAAGRSTAGLSAGGYASGLSLGDATYFGCRAGRAAVARR